MKGISYIGALITATVFLGALMIPFVIFGIIQALLEDFRDEDLARARTEKQKKKAKSDFMKGQLINYGICIVIQIIIGYLYISCS